MQGGLESLAIQEVLQIYGSSYRSRTYEWFRLARLLNEEKRSIIKKFNHADFNQAWILNNKFLLGEGIEAKFVLLPASLELALTLALYMANHGDFLKHSNELLSSFSGLHMI